MSLSQREAFARLMEHMVKHDGDGGHGYSQIARMGNGVPEAVDLGDGVKVTIAGGDRDCSSGVITCLRAVGVNTYGASYTGNMKSELLKTGLFRWERMGVASAKRGDIYLNEGRHTAVCTSAYGSAQGDMLAQFSISENGTIRGKAGDQTGRESNLKPYYSYPWDGKLVWVSDGEQIGDVTTHESFSPDLGDVRYWGRRFNLAIQGQLGTEADGVITGQWPGNKKYFWAVDGNAVTYENDGESAMTRALQRKFGVDDDGYMGYETIKGHQLWLQKLGYSVGSSGADGYNGHDTNRAVAQAIKDGKYR